MSVMLGRRNEALRELAALGEMLWMFAVMNCGVSTSNVRFKLCSPCRPLQCHQFGVEGSCQSGDRVV